MKKRLRDDQHAASVPAVDQYAGERRQREHGNLSRESHEAQKELRVGQPIDEPGSGDPRQPGSDKRNALTGKEKAVIPMPQVRQHRGKRPRIIAGRVG